MQASEFAEGVTRTGSYARDAFACTTSFPMEVQKFEFRTKLSEACKVASNPQRQQCPNLFGPVGILEWVRKRPLVSPRGSGLFLGRRCAQGSERNPAICVALTRILGQRCRQFGRPLTSEMLGHKVCRVR